jgi:hypothetical protein
MTSRSIDHVLHSSDTAITKSHRLLQELHRKSFAHGKLIHDSHAAIDESLALLGRRAERESPDTSGATKLSVSPGHAAKTGAGDRSPQT